MSDAKFTFLSWIRRGLTTQIQVDEEEEVTGWRRGFVDVRVSVNHDDVHAKSMKVHIYGPGDITGIDPRVVTRTWPLNSSTAVDPGYFASIEFDQADFPWRYNPTAPISGKLSPWLCLVVCADGESFTYQLPKEDQLGVLNITDAVLLPNLTQAWSFAHVQVNDLADTTDATLANLIRQSPENFSSRIVSPRVLSANKNYQAFLVPVFESGCKAGLGHAADPAVEIDKKSWISSPVELPVYYSWRFSTGETNDLLPLLAGIKAKPVPANVGKRELDFLDTGLSISIGGSLRPVGEAHAPAPLSQTIKDTIAALMAKDNSKVGPPQYARSYVSGYKNEPSWSRVLNSDPRFRVAAALGVSVIQKNQDSLMTSAWLQADGLQEVNPSLKKAQFSQVIAKNIFDRTIANADSAAGVNATALIHSKVTTTSQSGEKFTVRSAMNESALPECSFDQQFKRILRPMGSIAKRQGRNTVGFKSDLFNMMEAGKISPRFTAVPKLKLVTSPWARTKEVLDSVLGGTGRPDRTDTDDKSIITAKDAVAATAALWAVAESSSSVTPTQFKMKDLYGSLKTELHPSNTFSNRFRRRLLGGIEIGLDDPVEQGGVMAAPVFDQPMYRFLAELSQDWILPGLSELPKESVSLLVSDPSFIESFMLGLNDGMAKELKWNEFPTDMRGTYFSQFWESPDTADITPIAEWGQTELGKHCPRSTNAENLTFVIRSEIFRRYPGLQVYLSTGNLDTVKIKPILKGSLDPDIAFFGFDLKARDVVGTHFLVIQEQPSEPRLGPPVGTTITSGFVNLTTYGTTSAEVAVASMHKLLRIALPLSRMITL